MEANRRESRERAGKPEREEEFRALWHRTARPLWAYLARSSGDPALADDLVQEAYLRYLRSGFTPESDEHAKNYLYRIASNLLRDRHRRRSVRTAAGEVELEEDPRQGESLEPSPGAGPVGGRPADRDPQRRLLQEDLGRFLARLRPRDRQLLWLAYGEGASHREIAEILGVREASVRPMAYRARKRLAKILEEHGWTPEGHSGKEGR